jgi:Ala-tRNA(Pro) deacylase
VDLQLLREICADESVSHARETEFRDYFPDCELGAMPPFGNLYGIEVLVSEMLSRNEEIAFNAGNHSELIRMSYKDYESLVIPRRIRLSAV